MTLKQSFMVRKKSLMKFTLFKFHQIGLPATTCVVTASFLGRCDIKFNKNFLEILLFM